MNKILITLGTLFFAIVSNAQIKGITETGDQVILYDNKTWKYSEDSLNINTKIRINDKLFSKDKKSSFLVKSEKSNIGIWINPMEWSFTKAKSGGPSEFNFTNKKLDIYGMLISEKTEIPIKSLVEIAYDNAYEAAPDIKIIEKEYRNINGIDVIMMKMTGTIQGIKFIYFGYYYSSSKGAFQFLTYTSLNLFNEYEKDMLLFLNGLTEY